MKTMTLVLAASALGLSSTLTLTAANAAGQVQADNPTKTVAPAMADPVIKAGEKVTIQGKLQGGMMGIGGETTGWRLAYTTSKGAATIDVDMAEIKDKAALDGAKVTVTGAIFAKQYVERGEVLILKAATVKKAP
jgi:hypothetical protein